MPSGFPLCLESQGTLRSERGRDHPRENKCQDSHANYPSTDCLAIAMRTQEENR